MCKPHYIYTKEGASEALNYKTVAQINAPIRKAMSLGLQVCKTRCGVEYFDIEMIKHPEDYLPEEEQVAVVEVKEKRVHIQLTLF